MGLRSTLVLTIACFAFAAPLAFAGRARAPRPRITAIGGFSDGVGIENGRWTGQPDSAPDSASNRYLGQLAVDTYVYPKGMRNPYFWTIDGSHFGRKKGRVAIVRRPSGRSHIADLILSWTDTRIKVLATAPYGFTSEQARITVFTAPTRRHRRGLMAVPRDEDVVGMVKSRGYGQCTWFVAHTRIGAEQDIPPTAYTTTGAIPAVGEAAGDYRPRQWDCLTYGRKHVAIITSRPKGVRNRDGSIAWSFTVEEMNAAWDEIPSSSRRSYKLSAPDRNGRRTVLVGIGTNASRKWVASGYFR